MIPLFVNSFALSLPRAKIVLTRFRFYMDLFRCLYAVVFTYFMYPLETIIPMRL